MALSLRVMQLGTLCDHLRHTWVQFQRVGQSSHDCERPAKWREALDEEDCKTWRLYNCQNNPDAEECELVYDVLDSKPKKKKYDDLVPNLNSLNEVTAATSMPPAGISW